MFTVTPSTLIEVHVTRQMSGSRGGAVNCLLRRLSVKTISTDLPLFRVKLLTSALRFSSCS